MKESHEGARGGVGRLIERRSIDYVPLAERHGKVWHLWPVWFAGDAHLATVATGVVGVALGGNLVWMAIAVVLGSALGTFFMAFHSTQGPQLGLPQMIQSRPQFGYVGALLVWAVALIAYIGYNAFNQILAAQTIHNLYGGAAAPTMLGFTVLSVLFAVAGYDLIHVAQRLIAYTLIVALLVFTVAIAARASFTAQQLDLGRFDAVAFLAQVFAAASYQVSLPASIPASSSPAGTEVGFTGFVTPFGSAPPDFAAGTWMSFSQTQTLFDGSWAAPGVTAPFSTLTGAELLLSPATLKASAQDVIRIGQITVDPATLSGGLELLPDTSGTGQSFAIVHGKSETVDNFSTFNDLATALATDLNGTTAVRQVMADGSYAAGAITADHIIVMLND